MDAHLCHMYEFRSCIPYSVTSSIHSRRWWSRSRPRPRSPSPVRYPTFMSAADMSSICSSIYRINGSSFILFVVNLSVYSVCSKFVHLFCEGRGRAADRGRDRPVPQGALHLERQRYVYNVHLSFARSNKWTSIHLMCSKFVSFFRL